MRWIVGIDFKGRSAGALHLAAWLQQHARSEAQEFVGLHVLPESNTGLTEAALDGVHRVVTAAAIADPLAEARAPWAGSAEEGLTLAAADPTVTGILIGRAAGRRSHEIDRLGRVARRLLRRLPAPVLIAPPDLTVAQIGGGPILLATDLDETAVPAARLALRLARALDRELRIVSIDSVLYDAETIAPEAIIPLAGVPTRSVAEVEGWALAHEIEADSFGLGRGERINALLRAANECAAALLVCGSRCLSLGERIFSSSAGTELARRAACPVLVVPGVVPGAR